MLAENRAINVCNSRIFSSAFFLALAAFNSSNSLFEDELALTLAEPVAEVLVPAEVAVVDLVRVELVFAVVEVADLVVESCFTAVVLALAVVLGALAVLGVALALLSVVLLVEDVVFL